MRGLSPLERSLLQACASHYEPEEGQPPDAAAEMALEALVAAGRLQIVQVDGGAIYQTTSLGRLALSSATEK